MSLWLAKNQQSNEVVALQNALNLRLQPSTPLALDGIFGNHTEAAVKEFQKCEGLKADGIAGPDTLATMFERVRINTKIHVVALDGASAASPRNPVRRESSPFDSPKPGSPSAGRQLLDDILVQSLRRDIRSQSWLWQQPPKGTYPPFLPDPPQPKPQPVQDDRKRGTNSDDSVPSPYVQSSSQRARKVSLNPRRPICVDAILSDEWLEVEAAEETEFSGSKRIQEFETSFAFSMALVKLSRVAAPRFTFFVTPDRHWSVQGSVQLAKIPFYEHEFGKLVSKRGVFSVEPQLIGSVAWEKELHRHVELSAYGGVALQAERMLGRVGRNEFLIAWGLSAGVIVSNREKLRGLARFPTVAGQVLFNVAVKYGLGPRKHEH